ncbi:MAG: CoA pyrophosphatase [Desulfobacterales bacterium]|nr:CoA pyrophosphatase [Desulfobacterales bacterium]
MKPNKKYFCDEKLKLHIQKNLDCFQTKTHNKEGVQQAAVALAIVDVAQGSDDYGLPSYATRQPDAALILTRRSANLRNHSGQWALPGGHRDKGEKPADTALRELSEEVGLSLGPDRVIGTLDDFTTRSGFVITPVVIWGGDRVDLVPNPAEVASIHRVQLSELLRSDAPLIHESPDSSAPLILMPVGNTCIAAPTAAMLYQFREVALLGKSIRVAHYEQPAFAWK